MRNKQKQSALNRGFTLLELIIAIALMDVIAVSLYSSMHIGFSAKENAQAAMKPYRDILPVFEIIRNDLTCAMTPGGVLAGDFMGEDEAGVNQADADVLSFYSDNYYPTDDKISSNVIYVEYCLEEDTARFDYLIKEDASIRRDASKMRGEYSDKWEVVLKRKTIKNLLTTKTVVPDEEIVCRNIIGFDVKYYDGYSWQDTWDSTEQSNALPCGVQITLELPFEAQERFGGGGYEADLEYEDNIKLTRTYFLTATIPTEETQE